MSQTAIIPKSTLTITGTNGIGFSATGRDQNQNLTWTQFAATGGPSAANLLTQSSRWSNDRAAWKSKTVDRIASMETLASGNSAGYVAQPRVAAYSYYNLEVTRSALLSDADAGKSFDEFLYSCLADTPLRRSILGFQQADT